MAGAARLCVWLSRQICALHAARSRCELRVDAPDGVRRRSLRDAAGGSDTFSATCCACESRCGHHFSHAALVAAWRDGRLAENLRLRCAHTRPCGRGHALQERVRHERTHWFDTHPCDRDRVSRATAQEEVGLSGLTPSSRAVQDFDALAARPPSNTTVPHRRPGRRAESGDELRASEFEQAAQRTMQPWGASPKPHRHHASRLPLTRHPRWSKRRWLRGRPPRARAFRSAAPAAREATRASTAPWTAWPRRTGRSPSAAGLVPDAARSTSQPRRRAESPAPRALHSRTRRRCALLAPWTRHCGIDSRRSRRRHADQDARHCAPWPASAQPGHWRPRSASLSSPCRTSCECRQPRENESFATEVRALGLRLTSNCAHCSPRSALLRFLRT